MQIASDSPPDCAMIMLSLDAVIMMAHNCWCALAAAQRPPDHSVYLSMYLTTFFLSISLFFFSLSLSVTTLPPFLSFSSLIQTSTRRSIEVQSVRAVGEQSFHTSS